MSEYIDKSEAVGEGYLQDWYISSVSEDDEPVWTEARIEELANDFIVIPKDTPAADVAPVVHAKWYPLGSAPDLVLCSKCGDWNTYEAKYCPNCGAKMDGGGKT